MSNTQVFFLKRTITLEVAAEVLNGYACLQILQNNRNSFLYGSLVLLVCTPTPQESQGEKTLWVLHSTQASRRPVCSVLLGTLPPIHGHVRCPREQEPLLSWHLPSFPSVGNLMSPRFMFILMYFLKSVKYKLPPCVCVLFSFLNITSGTFLAQHCVYSGAFCPLLLEGHFALILLPHLSCLLESSSWNSGATSPNAPFCYCMYVLSSLLCLIILFKA